MIPVATRVEPDEHANLKAIASREHQTIAEYLRDLIRMEIKRRLQASDLT